MSSLLLLVTLLACETDETQQQGGPPSADNGPVNPPPPGGAPSPEAGAPSATPGAPGAAPGAPTTAPAPGAAPGAPGTPPAGAGYVPDDLAKAAYEAAKAAGADKKTNPKAGDAAAIAAGKTRYATVCASCHGATGEGDGAVGQALAQKPANFHQKDRWDYSTVGTKHWIVMNGIKGSAMAPLGLTEDQAWEVLAYIESDFAGK